MNRTCSALALSAIALGAVALGTTEASARPTYPEGRSAVVATDPHDWPDEGSGYPGSATESSEYNYPNYAPKYEVARVQAASAPSTSDDNTAEALQAGASALGGAGIAFGGIWLFRRRHPLAG